MFGQLFRSYYYKYSRLRLFKIGLLVLIAVSLFFTYQNIQVINALYTGNASSVNLDAGIMESPFRTVRDALLSSPYQATVLFSPILIALTAVTDYQLKENEFTSLLCTKWKIRLLAQVSSLLLVSIMITVIMFVVNALFLKLLLVEPLQPYLTIGLMLDVFSRIVPFTITLSLFSILFVTVTKRATPSLLAVVFLLILSLSGILKVISPILDHLLPLIGAKSFAFGRVESGQTSQTYGFFLLLLEAILVCVCLLFIERNRWEKTHV